MTQSDGTGIREAYERDGYCFPLRAMSPDAAKRYIAALEAHELAHGGPLQSNMRHQVHLLFTWSNELVRHATALDAVEEAIGPNILCWVTNFFIKEPKDGDFVSWHQDATYWGLEPHDKIITAWLAFTDVPVQSGAMKFMRGSRRSSFRSPILLDT